MTSSLRHHLAHEPSGLSSFEPLEVNLPEVRERFLGCMVFTWCGGAPVLQCA